MLEPAKVDSLGLEAELLIAVADLGRVVNDLVESFEQHLQQLEDLSPSVSLIYLQVSNLYALPYYLYTSKIFSRQ